MQTSPMYDTHSFVSAFSRVRQRYQSCVRTNKIVNLATNNFSSACWKAAYKADRRCIVADDFCHITFPVSKWLFYPRYRRVWKKQMLSFLREFFSHSSLRELQERCRSCHITFRESSENGRLREPGALQM